MTSGVRYYTGVGSRQSKDNVVLKDKIFRVARILALERFILRSGHAEGSDKAFEDGCIDVSGLREIYLPWKGFNGSSSHLEKPLPEAYVIAEGVLPHWHNLTPTHRALHARDAHQVLGGDLKTPSEFLVCWTPGGRVVGGTATAIRVAVANKIPVYNLGSPDLLGLKPMELVSMMLEGRS